MKTTATLHLELFGEVTYLFNQSEVKRIKGHIEKSQSQIKLNLKSIKLEAQRAGEAEILKNDIEKKNEHMQKAVALNTKNLLLQSNIEQLITLTKDIERYVADAAKNAEKFKLEEQHKAKKLKIKNQLLARVDKLTDAIYQKQLTDASFSVDALIKRITE